MQTTRPSVNNSVHRERCEVGGGKQGVNIQTEIPFFHLFLKVVIKDIVNGALNNYSVCVCVLFVYVCVCVA